MGFLATGVAALPTAASSSFASLAGVPVLPTADSTTSKQGEAAAATITGSSAAAVDIKEDFPDAQGETTATTAPAGWDTAGDAVQHATASVSGEEARNPADDLAAKRGPLSPREILAGGGVVVTTFCLAWEMLAFAGCSCWCCCPVRLMV
jgi:hypothetical protein